MIKLSVKQCFLILVCILLISFSFNIYFSLDNRKYEKKIGEKSNNEICLIRDKNESNLIMLEMVTEKGTISKQDITKLYSNYNEISKSLYILLGEYNEYKDEGLFFTKKTVQATDVMLDDIYVKINSFILYIMENSEIQTIEDRKVFILNDIDKNNLHLMYDLAQEIKQYFDLLIEEYPIDEKDNKFKKAIIKDKLWIDVLDDLKNINGNYTDFTLPAENK